MRSITPPEMSAASPRLRVWTIQPRDVWQQLEAGDQVFVDRSRASYGAEGLWQYDWLAHQLRDRLSGYTTDYPWWAYGQKPDLRSYGRCLCLGVEYARIELEVRATEWTRFPVWMWNTVYSGDYLAPTRADYDAWHHDLVDLFPEWVHRPWPLPEPLHSRLAASWTRVFDTALHGHAWVHDLSRDDPIFEELLEPSPSDYFEAAGASLRREDVRGVTFFRGRGRV